MISVIRCMIIIFALICVSSTALAQSRITGLHKKQVETEPAKVTRSLPNQLVQEKQAPRGRITGLHPVPQKSNTNRSLEIAESDSALATLPSLTMESSLLGGVDSLSSNHKQPDRLRSSIIGLRKKSELSFPVVSIRPPPNSNGMQAPESRAQFTGFRTLQEQVEAKSSSKLDTSRAEGSQSNQPSDELNTTIPTRDPKSDPLIAACKEWMISGSRSRYLPLLEAIHKSLVSKRVIHSLGNDVSVESVTLLDPEITALQIPFAQSRFDPILSSQAASNHVDRPPSSFFSGGIPIANKREEIEFSSRLSKEWATGTTTSVGYEPSLAYLFFPAGNSGGFNPINSSDLVMQATQPLLRGAGRPTNLATIRIAENRLEQSRFEVESKLQQQLRSIEQAYWQLHANHVRRKAISDAILLSYEIVELERNRFEAGRVIYTDVARARFKLEDLFQQKLKAEKEIQRISLQIAQLSGMEMDPSTMLEPSDVPERRKPDFDLNAVTAVALQRNPNLLRQRYEIAVRQNQVQVARNQLQPQLDLRSSVRSSGLDDDLGSSLRDMSRFEFVDVSVGLVYARQVGNRAAKSKYRQTELEAVRVREILDAFERQVGFNIAESLNTLQLSFATFESSLRQLAESQQWVKLAKIRYESPPAESGPEALLVSLLDYQSAIQSQVDSLLNAALALADYNTKLASVEEQRGTLLDRWGIAISNSNTTEPSQILSSP